MVGMLWQEFYPAGTYIVRQGARGDNFFIIASGRVRITQRLPGNYTIPPLLISDCNVRIYIQFCVNY